GRARRWRSSLRRAGRVGRGGAAGLGAWSVSGLGRAGRPRELQWRCPRAFPLRKSPACYHNLNNSSAAAFSSEMPTPTAPDLTTMIRDHAARVRRVLARRGVRPSDLPDAEQEVFMVAHRKLAE